MIRSIAISETTIRGAMRLMMVGALTLAITLPALPQSSELQQKLAAVKQAAAQNKKQLRQYQWIETTQLTLKGDAKPPTRNSCLYGPDGKVQKTAIGAPPEEPSGGRLKQKIIAKKKAEMKDYMQDVKAVLSMYVPPDPQKMQADYQAGKVSLNPVPGAVNLIFTDYAQPNDKMTLTFDTATKKITALNINTYMGKEKDVVTLQVQMSYSAGRHQLRGANSSQRNCQGTRGNHHKFELPKARRAITRRKRCRHVASTDEHSARRHQLRGANSPQRNGQGARSHDHKFELSKAWRAITRRDVCRNWKA